MASSWRQTLLFARQALIDPHRGSNLGIAWMYLQPLVMILIYTLVFSRFMSARLPGIESPYAYSLYLVPGLLLWTVFANVVNGMAGVYQGKAHIIRKIPVDMRLMPLYLPLVEIVREKRGQTPFSRKGGLTPFLPFLLLSHVAPAACVPTPALP